MIEARLEAQLQVVNFRKLSVDKAGLPQIIDFAIKAGLLPNGLDIDAFADTRFNVLGNKQ